MYSQDYRKAVIEVCTALGRKIRATAKLVKASASTICRWMNAAIAEQNNTKKSRASIITDAIIQTIQQYIEENPAAVAHEITHHVNKVFDLNVSRQLIYLILTRKMNLTYKKGYIRNKDLSHDPKFQAHIRNFCDFVHESIKKGTTIVSFDESGVDPSCKRISTYSPKGQPTILYGKPSKDKHERTSILTAIASNGQSFVKYQKGSVVCEDVADFIIESNFPPNSIFILDNHSMHGTDVVVSAIYAKDYIPVFCPPYSPELNPVENIFGTVKSAFKKERYKASYTCIDSTLQALFEKHSDVAVYFNHLKSLPKSNFPPNEHSIHQLWNSRKKNS